MNISFDKSSSGKGHLLGQVFNKDSETGKPTVESGVRILAGPKNSLVPLPKLSKLVEQIQMMCRNMPLEIARVRAAKAEKAAKITQRLKDYRV